MPYEEYLATAHLRETPMRDTYYVIPGSTVVEFHDESGRVLWRFVTDLIFETQSYIRIVLGLMAESISLQHYAAVNMLFRMNMEESYLGMLVSIIALFDIPY